MIRKIIIGIGTTVLLLTMAFVALFQGALQQDEHHLAVFRAIAKLTVSSEELVRVNTSTFVQKTGAGDLPIITYLQQRGWVFAEQMGSGLFFERGGKRSVVVSRQYSRYYRLVDVSDIPQS